MQYTVKALEKSDRNQWEKLYRGYADFYQVPMNDEILNCVWEWVFDTQKQFFAFVVKDETGVAVGFMHFCEMASPLRGANVGFLNDLFLDPNCRGNGIVDLMFEHLKKVTQEQGWPFIRWVTADNNYRARAVYDRVANKTQWLTYQLDS